MATMNISLPDPMREYVEERLEEDGYSTASEFFRDLIRQDQRQRAINRLERLIEGAIESGPAVPLTEEHWQSLHDDLEAKIKDRGRAGA